MIKFHGKPNQVVLNKSTGNVLLTFDASGEFVTEDENIIRYCNGVYDASNVLTEEEFQAVVETAASDFAETLVEVPTEAEVIPEVVEVAPVRTPRNSRTKKMLREE